MRRAAIHSKFVLGAVAVALVVLVLGAAQVVQGMKSRDIATRRTADDIATWHEQIALELVPEHAAEWRRAGWREPMALLRACCVEVPVSVVSESGSDASGYAENNANTRKSENEL